MKKLLNEDLQELHGSLVLDTGVLVEYLIGSSKCGRIIREYFAALGRYDKIHVSIHAVSEICYILCRARSIVTNEEEQQSRKNRSGRKFASEKLVDLLESNALIVHSSIDFAMKIGELKCERSLSIVDCSAIALAESLNLPACFVREKELEREISRKPFAVDILLLDCD